jgi:hypothetical protein
MRPFNLRILAAALLAAAPITQLSAQTLREQTRALRADPVDTPTHIISINPFLVLFGYFAGEYEQRVNPSLSVAAAGSYVNFDGDRYTNLDLKARLYPNEQALQGFGFAASVGLAGIHANHNDVCAVLPSLIGAATDCASRSTTFASPSLALELQYQWMLGAAQHTAITLGGGLKRYLASEQKFRSADVPRMLPTLRASIGYAY